MYGEAKKLELIEDICKIENDSILDEVKIVIAKGKIIELPKRRNLVDFVGLFTDEELNEMENVIEEGCEQIHPNDWK